MPEKVLSYAEAMQLLESQEKIGPKLLEKIREAIRKNSAIAAPKEEEEWEQSETPWSDSGCSWQSSGC